MIISFGILVLCFLFVTMSAFAGALINKKIEDWMHKIRWNKYVEEQNKNNH